MPGPTLRAALDARQALDRVVVPPAIGSILDSLELVGAPAAPSFTDAVLVTADVRFGFADLALDPGGPAIPVELALEGPAAARTGFRIDLRPADDRLTLPAALVPAALVNGALQPAGGGPARLRGALVIRIDGAVDGVATLRVLAPGAAADAVVTLTVEPPAVLFGSSGFGLELLGGLVLDDSSSEAPPQPADLRPGAPAPPSATSSWRGVAIRGALLHAPAGAQLLGGRPIAVAFEVGNPAGIWGRASVTLPPAPGLPEIAVSVAWDDPAGTSLGDALPTLVEAVAQIPVAGASAAVPGAGPATVEGPPTVTLRTRYARDPRAASPSMTGSIAVEGSGPDGLAVVRGSGSPAGRTVVAAAAFATALMADASPAPSPSGASGGTSAALLLGVAAALGDALGDGSVLVINRVEAQASSADPRAPLQFSVDYSAAVAMDPINLKLLKISLDPNVPLRARVRNVRLEYDPTASGLERINLNYADAEFAVEDPGRWTVEGPGDLFDVVGTRSGNGSTWFEIDLRFAVDLGPLQVSGATIRATFDGGAPVVELRGLAAQVVVPGIIKGSGSTDVTEDGVEAALAATLVPLQIGALAFASYETIDGLNKVAVAFGVDLPGPIPLANSGLGIFGFLGFFVANGKLALPGAPNDDPVARLLRWKPWESAAFAVSGGDASFGVGAIVGTVPDLGFAFSTKAVLAVTVPDVAVRASLQAKVIAPRLRFADITAPVGGGVGLSLLGALAIDASGVVIGLRADFTIPHLVKVVVPFGAGFPTSGRNWFVHLGADGVNGRGPAPIEAFVLPGTLDIGGWAFLMVRGNGMADLGGIAAFDLAGFAVGFGFGIRATLGAVIVRLDITASAIVGVGTDPFVLVGRGRLAGELVLGPVSIGVSAEMDLQVGPRDDDRWVRMEVCGEVDLFFFSLRGCVEIDVGKVNKEIPPPTSWPLQGLVLTDHRYGDAVTASETAAGELPVVWPDAIPILQFSTGPANALDPNSQFAPVLAGTGPGGWAGTTAGDGAFGSHDLRYTFRLTRLDLFELTSGGEMLVQPGPGASPAAGGGLEAAWQLPKHGNPKSTLPGARELALLTWEPHLWTRVLPDGGAKLPDDPLAPLADVCRPQPIAVAGWALGGLASGGSSDEGAEARWTLPPEPGMLLLASRYVSEFTVEAEVAFLGDEVLSDARLHERDVPGGMRIGGTVVLADGVALAERSFGGGLALPHALESDVHEDPLASYFMEIPLRATLTSSEPLSDPFVAFEVAARNVPLFRMPTVIGLRHRPGDPPQEVAWEQIDGTGTPTGGDAQGWAPTSGEGGPWIGAVVEYDARSDITLLGLRGVTVSAESSAAAAAAAAASASGALDQRQADPPGAGRSLLKPGTRYRLLVGQQATGERPGQTAETFPTPATNVERSFFFRTADDALPAPAGQPLSFSVLFGSRDEFDVRYLERYLLGYVPGDHAEAWFTGDPVAVHFHADHVAQLASLYNRELLLRCRRTDTPPGAPEDPEELRGLVALIAVQFASVSDQLLRFGTFRTAVELGGSCPMPPTGGASLAGLPALAPNAAYDLAAAFPRTGPVLGGAMDALRGVTFTTSRWRDPDALLAGLSYAAAPGVPVLDVPAAAPGALPQGIGDDLVQDALRQFGLERWPAAATARSVALWTQASAAAPWLLAGVLLEAPEPIHRPNVGGVARITVDSLACAGGAFLAPIRDRAGTRLIFPAAGPFTPAGPLELRGAQQPFVVTGQPPAPTPFTVRAAVGAMPRFAEDL